MSVRVWKPWTPDIVVRNGWRDVPYVGPKKLCDGCSGWGTRFTTVGEDAVIMHATCRDCGGKGHQ